MSILNIIGWILLWIIGGIFFIIFSTRKEIKGDDDIFTAKLVAAVILYLTFTGIILTLI